MRGLGAYAIAASMVFSVLCCANFAFASDVNSTALGTTPAGNDLSFIDIGGFLRLLGGFLRVGITGPSSGSSGGSSGNNVVCQGYGNNVGITDAYGTTWHDLCIGAGGFITGIDIASDGTKVIYDNTYGAYLWNGTQWQELVTTATMPAGSVVLNDNGGVYDIRIAPSNTNIFYMNYNNCSGCVGGIYVTTNRGTTWSKTNFAPSTPDPYGEANGNYAGDGQKIAIDPANANVVYVGTESSGLWMTANGGSTWTNIASSSVPFGAAITGIAFDPSSGTTTVGGVIETNTIYAGSWGYGVYRSTNAGVTWTLLSGGPTTVTNAEVASSTYFAADGTSAWKYSGGTWTNMLNNGGNGLQTIAVDPANPSRIVVGSSGGTLNVSTDGGATWGGPGFTAGAGTRVATDIPWLAWTNENYMTSAAMVFDPTASNKLYFAEGIGVWWSNPPSTASAFNWYSQSAGIEQLVADEVISPPGGVPIVASWDRPAFQIGDPDVYPSMHGPNNSIAISRGYSVDYASNDPSFIIVSTDNDGPFYSTNGGSTWSLVTGSAPSGYAGDIVAASSTDMVWVPWNANPAYTTNGGATWTTVSGVTSAGWTLYLNRFIVAADRVNIGTFYLYNGNGVFRSTDGGATWTEVYTGELIPFDWYNSELEAMPTKAGYLFYSAGQASPDSLTSPQNEPFIYSTNGGVSWNDVPNVLEVKTFGFGAPAAGTTTPAIYIDGWVNSHYGIWRSIDGGVSWSQIGLWPINSLDQIQTISGDMNTYGRVYVGFQGSGYAYGDTSDAAPWIAFSTPIQMSAVSGSSVTLTAISSGSVPISNVQFKIGNTDIGSAITSAPYTTTWNSTGVSDGSYTLYAVAKGTSGAYATSSITVQVENTPPTTPTNLMATASSSSEIDLSWTASTDNNGVAGYQIFRNSVQVGTTTSGTTYADTGLAASTTYSYTVDAYDAIGNVSGMSSSTSATTQAGVAFIPTADPPIQDLSYGGGTATFSSVNIGTAASNRVVVVGVADNDPSGCCGSAITGVTIGGTTATEAAYSETTPKSDATLWYATIASGTTANIVVSGAGQDVGVLVGTIVGASSAAPSATSTHPITSAGGDPQLIPLSGTMTVPSDGTAVLFGVDQYYETGTAIWTNTTSAAGDYLLATSSTEGYGMVELLTHSYATGAQSYGVSSSNSNGYGYGSFAGVAAAWGP